MLLDIIDQAMEIIQAHEGQQNQQQEQEDHPATRHSGQQQSDEEEWTIERIMTWLHNKIFLQTHTRNELVQKYPSRPSQDRRGISW